MKKAAFLLALAVAVGCAPRAEKLAISKQEGSGALRFLVTEWRPYTDRTGGERLAIDLVEGIFRKLGSASRFQIVPDGTLDTALEESVFTGTAAVWWSETRARSLVYSDAYFENQLILVSANGSDTTVPTLAAIGKKRVAVIAGYAYGSAFLEAKETEFVRAATSAEAFRAMVDGEVDYLLADRLVVRSRSQSYPEADKSRLTVGERAVEKRSLHLGVRKEFPGALALVEEFNRGLRRSLADGSYHRAFQLVWVLADLDGDGREEFVSSSDVLGKKPPLDETTIRVPLAAGARNIATEIEPVYVVLGKHYSSWEAIPEAFRR